MQLAPVLVALAIAAGTAALSGLWRTRVWRRGATAKVAWLPGLIAVPRRYLVDVHRVVARDPVAARMHVLAAGGLVATLLLSMGTAILRLPVLPLATMLAAALLALGAVLAIARRTPRPARLSASPFGRLPFALLGLSLFIGIPASADAGLIDGFLWRSPGGSLLMIAGIAALLALVDVGRGPMRHAFAGTLHLAFHPRPARFAAGALDTALAPIDLSADRLGVTAAHDFDWNRLLSFDACVQCGRCEEACPAFAAGQPLNPKALVFDLVKAAEGDAPAGEDTLLAPETLWACTTCRACVDACPMLIEHVDAVVDLRRGETLERGAAPGAAGLFEALKGTDNHTGRPAEARTAWTAGLPVRTLGEGERCAVLLWVGEAAFAPRGQRTLRALAELLIRAGIDFAVLGAAEKDCGDVARRLGEEAIFQRLARENIALLSRRGFDTILTADPHALHVLRNEYPAFGGHYEVVHHSAFLARLVSEGALRVVAPLPITVTYHDPCYLGRYNGEFEAPRALLGQIAGTLVEMERHGHASFCCGAGGGAAVTDIPGKRRIPDVRMEQAAATGAHTVAVGCPNCAVMFDGAAAPGPEVRDLAELLRDATGQA